MIARDTLHSLIDGLPEEKLSEVGELLNRLVPHPLPPAFLHAEIDDEPLTEEENKGLAEAREEWARGELKPLLDAFPDLVRNDA